MWIAAIAGLEIRNKGGSTFSTFSRVYRDIFAAENVPDSHVTP